MPVPLYVYVILASLVTALIFFRKFKRSFLVLFVPFLFITLFAEIGAVFYKYVLDRSNGWIYNIYLIIQVCFFSFFFYRVIKNSRQRLLIGIIAGMFFLLSVGYYLFIGTVREFNTVIFVSGGLVVTLFSVLFLFHYFLLDDKEEEESLSPLLYITGGVVIYFSVVSVTITLYPHLQELNVEIGGTQLYNWIPRVLSILMYTLFAYSFYLCSRRKLTY
jgi:hypothetical protein